LCPEYSRSGKRENEYVFRGGKAVTEASYDQLIDQFIQDRLHETDTVWRQAAKSFFLREHMAVPAKIIGGDVGLSGKYITEMAKTFEVFPNEEDRAQDKSFSLHKECAYTDDPVGWLEKALEQGWSVRELKRAVKDGKPDPDPVEQAAKLWQKVLDAIEEGGPAAEYLREQVELGVDIIPEASKAQETQAASI